MKSITTNANNSLIKEKYSKKRLNNISNRIRSLEKDINKIKNKENYNNRKSTDKNKSIAFDKNSNTMINDETENKPQNKKITNHNSFVKNYLFSDNKPKMKFNTNNSSSNKEKKYKKDYSKSKIFKKINNYNNLIHEKKNILLNMKSHFHKRANTKDAFKNFTRLSLTKNVEPTKNIYKNNFNNGEKNFNNIKVHSGIQSNKKTRHVISMDKINTNYESNDLIKEFKDSICNNKKNDMGNLEYEFELRHLKKKRNLLKTTNEEMISKLEGIKNKNLIMKNNIVQEQKHNENLMNNIILLSKNYSINNNPNGLESIESITNRSNSEDISFKNIILNIMDIKFEYENNILYNCFFEGVNELLNKSIMNNNNNYNYNYNDDILKEINNFTNLQKSLNKSNDKYKFLIEENTKYLTYFTSLLNDLNIQNLDELGIFIQNIFVKNIKENERIKKIKNALINESSPDKKQIRKEKENIKRKISNQYINNINQTFFNFNNENKDISNYSKLKESYMSKNKKIKNKTINNYYPRDSLNRTEKNNITNIKYTLDESNLKNDFQSLLYENDKRNNYIPLNHSIKRINKNDLSEINDIRNNKLTKNNCYNGNRNFYGRYCKNNYLKNEDDIMFVNKNEESKNDNNYNRLSFGLTKNNSAYNILFNKYKNK